MEFNKLVFAGLSVACLAAAAGGSYLAVRQNQSAAAVTSEQLGPAPTAPIAPAAPAVTESEGVITPEPAKPARPELPPSPVRRTPTMSSAPTSATRASTRPTSAPISQRSQ